MADKKKWDGKAKGSTLGNLIFIKIISVIGPFPAYLLLLLVPWYYALFDHEGILALRKFRKRLGFKSTNIWHLYRHFSSFGMELIDRVAFNIIKKPPFKYTFVNENYISDALSHGKGAIMLSAHIGNWEIAGNLLFDHFNTCIHVVMLDNEQQKIKDVFREAIEKRLFKTILISQYGLDMIIPIKSALKNNEIVCFHGDRVIGQSGVSLPFFGEKAEFPIGPFQIAAITGAPIVPVFIVKDSMYHYTFMAYDPITFDDATRENRSVRIRQAMESYVIILEDVAKKYPYQWFNFFDIWASDKDNEVI